MTYIRIRILGVLTLGQDSWGLTDIAEATTLDFVVHDDRSLSFAIEDERDYLPVAAEDWAASHQAGIDLNDEWRYDLTNMLTMGLQPDFYAAYGADAFITLGILPRARWLCLGRAVTALYGQDAGISLSKLLTRLKIPADDTSDLFGGTLDAWRSGLLLQHLLGHVSVEQLLQFRACGSDQRILPPIDDAQAWSRVSDYDLQRILTSGRYPIDVTACARREEAHRKERLC